uniref:Uncharacterized protein n=1 Tax=Tetranychus urticae TaxID=32264 RepID=T1K138_TETUR
MCLMEITFGWEKVACSYAIIIFP